MGAREEEKHIEYESTISNIALIGGPGCGFGDAWMLSFRAYQYGLCPTAPVETPSYTQT